MDAVEIAKQVRGMLGSLSNDDPHIPYNDVLLLARALLKAVEHGSALLDEIDQLVEASEGVAGLDIDDKTVSWDKLFNDDAWSEWLGQRVERFRATLAKLRGDDAA